MIHEIQHVSLKSDKEEIRKLPEKDPPYAKLIENMKLKMTKVKEITVKIPIEHYIRKTKAHERNLEH